ncbi:MAG TPA: ABC transporter permease [Micromonosporaceae bacterium]|jgi:NitT/TauT family transport system permease protein
MTADTTTARDIDAMDAVRADALWRRLATPRRVNLTIGIAVVVAFFVIWQLAYELHWANAIFIGSPTGVVRAFIDMVKDGTMATDCAVTAKHFAIGYALGAVAGIALGTLIGWYDRLGAALQPLLSGLYSTPKVAIFPLFIIWLGIGNGSKILIVFLDVLFQTMFNTAAGVRSVDRSLVRVARSYGAGDWRLFRDVAIPGAVPFVITGLRLGVGSGIIGVIFAELYVGNDGLGFVIAQAGQTFQTDKLLAAVFVVVITSVILMSLLRWVESRIDSWRPAQ